MKQAFSIRYKFLAVTTFLLVVCLGVYLLIATEILRSDKQEVVFDYNRSRVMTLAADANGYFETVFNYLSLIAHFSHLSKNSKEYTQVISLVKTDGNLVYLGKSDPSGKWTESFYLNPIYLATYEQADVDANEWNNKLNTGQAPPLSEIKERGHAIWPVENSNPPLIGLGKMVIEEDRTKKSINQYVVVGYVKTDRFIEAMAQSGMGQHLITNYHGKPLVMSESTLLDSSAPALEPANTLKVDSLEFNSQKTLNPDLKDFQHLIDLAKKSPVKVGVLSYGPKGRQFLGAYSEAYQGQLFVFSKISHKRAFAAVGVLVSRSLKFALIVITSSFLVAIFFSRTLTRPIESLVAAMRRVAAGDLSTQISLKAKDEIGWLASSFNTMTQDLKGSRDALDSLNKNLESKVYERTEQLNLQNQAVKEAQEALLKTTRLAAVGEVAGQAAHEVLNPLTSLMSRVERMKDRAHSSSVEDLSVLDSILTAWESDKGSGGFGQLVAAWEKPIAEGAEESLWDEDMKNFRALAANWKDQIHSLDEDAQFLLQEGNRIHRIMDSMRAMNHSKGELKVYSIHDLLLRGVNIMSDLAAQKGTKIQLNCQASEDRVLVDEDEFIQSLTNLIRNSLQAIDPKRLNSNYAATQGDLKTPDRGGSFEGVINIVTANEAGLLNISIQDNGVGISAANQQHLFELHFSTKGKDEGTGLGLNISRRFIRRFHGDLCLEKSAEQIGATFLLQLPIANAQKVGVAV